MHLLKVLLAILAWLLGLGGREEAGLLPYAGASAEPIPASEVGDYRNRCFDPATGRFLQRDPVLGGDELFNPYCFPSNNPVTGSDPMGLFSPSVHQHMTAEVLKGMSASAKLTESLGRGAMYPDLMYSHVAREEQAKGGAITRFQDYRKQSPTLHGEDDEPKADSDVYKRALQASKDLIKLADDATIKDDQLEDKLRESFYKTTPEVEAGKSETKYLPRPR